MFCDTLTLDRDSLELTEAGYLHINARIARAGVQDYAGAEVGRPDLDRVQVTREAEEVFARASVASFANVPITNDHPADPVTAETWREVAVGNAGEEVMRDGDYLKIGLRITDAKAIADIQAGKRELSVGYSADLVWDGDTARQTNIRANHIALVDRGRAGPAVRIGTDPNPPTSQPKETSMKTKTHHVTVDGLALSLNDAEAAETITLLVATRDELQRKLADSIAAAKDLSLALETAQDALAKTEGERDAAKAKTREAAEGLSAEEIHDAALARGNLIAEAKALGGHTARFADRASNTEIMAAVLTDRGIDVAGKPPAYVQARFDALKDSAGDPVSGAHLKARASQAQTGRTTYLHTLQNAWKGD